MNQVILTSTTNQPIKPLIKSALVLEKKELLTAIFKTKQNLLNFEKKYNLTTTKFISHQNSIKIVEMEAIEWSGEHKTLNLLKQKLSNLEEIRICK